MSRIVFGYPPSYRACDKYCFLKRKIRIALAILFLIGLFFGMAVWERGHREETGPTNYALNDLGMR